MFTGGPTVSLPPADDSGARKISVSGGGACNADASAISNKGNVERLMREVSQMLVRLKPDTTPVTSFVVSVVRSVVVASGFSRTSGDLPWRSEVGGKVDDRNLPASAAVFSFRDRNRSPVVGPRGQGEVSFHQAAGTPAVGVRHPEIALTVHVSNAIEQSG